jgi:Ca2+-binding RTX toxin-like protein
MAVCLMALTVPLAPAAFAQTPSYTLDCDDAANTSNDTVTNNAGESETYTCHVTATGQTVVSDLQIDGENLNGANDPDNSAAAGTADFNPACTTGTNGICQFTLAPAATPETGTANVCFWVDSDGDAVFDPAGAVEDGGGCDAEAATVEDNNSTDVVQKIWSPAPVSATALDCDDESGDDAETNAFGVGETYTCLATAADGADADTARDPVAGVRVDWENLNGANDADNSSAAGTADANDACTTAANGTCTLVIAPSENQTGAANICFWGDTDNDNVFDPNGAANDGAGCNNETPVTEDLDLVDVATKTWTGVTPDGLDCDDASGDDAETNNLGQSEVYTCTATAPDSADAGTERDPAPGVRIDWENLNGANDPDNSLNNATPDGNDGCTTAANGTCQITIVPTENAAGAATICFWADTDADNVFADTGATSDGGGCNAETAATEDTDLIDTVTKTWAQFADLLDCDDQSGDDLQNNNATESETYTCTTTAPDSLDNGNERDPIAAQRIDYENLNGVNDPDNSSAAGTADGNDACTTAANGVCTINIAPTEAQTGTANICFWVDTDNDNVFDPAGAANDGGGCLTETPPTEDTNLLDVVTKNWSSTLARVIDCEPETSSHDVGAEQTITCTVYGVTGQKLSGQSVTFQETGAGDFVSATVVTTDPNGTASVTVKSTTELGDQTVTGVLTDDLTGTEPADVDECDRAANDPSGAAAGACSDAVTVTWTPVNCLGQPGEILGTAGDDVITGTEGNDVICAGAGNDIVNGLGGDDIIKLGAGNDRASGGSGRDDIAGGSGQDNISGDADGDRIRGQADDDTLSGGDGGDLVVGGGGDDEIRGAGSADTLRGGDGNDSLFGGGGPDLLVGGRGSDLCRGGPGRDALRSCER